MGRERGPAFYDRHYAHEPKRARSITYRRHKVVSRWVAGNSVLDLGCGVSLVANMIDSREYLGIDFSQEAIDASRRICENPNATFLTGSVFDEDLLPDRMYDTVIAVELLEHLDDPHRVIELATARCKQRLIMTVPRDMRAPSHVKQKWTRQDIHSLIGPPSVLYLFGGENDDWWWIAVKDMEVS